MNSQGAAGSLHALAAAHRDLFVRPRSFVFLVSHMRSYSSLLGHLLAETSEIDGYSELHHTYESELDLLGMTINVQRTHAAPLSGDRLFDKLLHRAWTIAPPLIVRSDVSVIFSVRTPMDTLASLIALGERDPSVKWAANPEGALRHYTRRLDDVSALAATAQGGCFLVADELMIAPRKTLDALGTHLELSQTIPTSYSKHLRTGLRKFGDSSDRISSLTLSAPASTPSRHRVPADVLALGQQRFDELLSDPAIRRLTPIAGSANYLQ